MMAAMKIDIAKRWNMRPAGEPRLY